jgi:hypothetical protein
MENTILFGYRCVFLCLTVFFLGLIRKLPLSTTSKFIFFGYLVLGAVHYGQFWAAHATQTTPATRAMIELVKPDFIALSTWIVDQQERFIYFTLLVLTIRLMDAMRL